MANEDHLRILNQGLETWNKWREENPDVRPDLSGIDLEESNLYGAILRGALLIQTNLSKSNLFKAKLRGAVLTGTNLQGCYLVDADLRDAHIYKTDLTNSDLTGALLSRTCFISSSLYGVDLKQALLQETVFFDTVLSAAKGLGLCDHWGPSNLDYRTLARSEGIPLNFLRGCGLPDKLIEYLPSLLNEAIRFHSCFISYSSKDHKFAERLHADLQNKGVRCWFAPEDLKIGDKFRQRIDESIHVHDKLLVILSENSLSSSWVEDEVENALERERIEKRLVLFPICIDDSISTSKYAWATSLRRQRHIGNFSDWKNHDLYLQACDRLMRDLKAEESTGDRA